MAFVRASQAIVKSVLPTLREAHGSCRLLSVRHRCELSLDFSIYRATSESSFGRVTDCAAVCLTHSAITNAKSTLLMRKVYVSSRAFRFGKASRVVVGETSPYHSLTWKKANRRRKRAKKNMRQSLISIQVQPICALHLGYHSQLQLLDFEIIGERG